MIISDLPIHNNPYNPFPVQSRKLKDTESNFGCKITVLCAVRKAFYINPVDVKEWR